MKSIKILSVMLVVSFFCLTGCNSKSDDILLQKKDIVGDYQGTYFSCGKEECTTVDANFRIVNNDSKYFLEYEAIREEVEIDYFNKIILSANPIWNSSGTSATYGLSGTFEEDNVKIVFAIPIIMEDVYQNELIGKKLK
jgi:hypothetical protein